jgi:hypothetical protein
MGSFATEHHAKVIKQMKAAIQAGRLGAERSRRRR